jgi:hypothetical protein
MRHLLPRVFAALSVVAGVPAYAQFMHYASRPAFSAAAGPLVTEAFSMPFQDVPEGGAAYMFSAGTMTFDANHGFELFGGGNVVAELRPSGEGVPQFLRIDFSQPVTAFGADFLDFDTPSIFLRAFIGGSTFQIHEGFFGVVSTVPFTRVEIRDPSEVTFFFIDNLSFATVVPEPGTLWLVGGGVIMGAFARRRWPK